jgi:diaminopimelate epimerase
MKNFPPDHTIYKYHSLCNDVLIIDCISDQWWAYIQDCVSAGYCSKASQLLHRHSGIGADCLIVWRCDEQGIQAYVFNADGSYGQICINGARCLVAHFDRHYKNTTHVYEFRMGSHTLCGALHQNTYGISLGYGQILADSLAICTDNTTFSGSFVDVGNPHYIVRVDSVDEALRYAQTYGLALSTHQTFSAGANISFLVEDFALGAFSLITYERGCGLTYACGSAVCATATLLRESLLDNKMYKFQLRGGDCSVMLSCDYVSVYAPVCEIMQGKISSDCFSQTYIK